MEIVNRKYKLFIWEQIFSNHTTKKSSDKDDTQNI